MPNKAWIYFSSDGDKIEEVRTISSTDAKTVNFNNFNDSKLHPILEDAKECDSLEKVAALLDKIIEDKECKVTVTCFHRNNSEVAGHVNRHDASKKAFHEEGIEAFKRFVQFQMSKPTPKRDDPGCKIM